MRARCHSTVRTLRWTCSAISRLVCPSASSASTSRSRRLSLSGAGSPGPRGRSRRGRAGLVEAEGDHVRDRLDQAQLGRRERPRVAAAEHLDLPEDPPAGPHGAMNSAPNPNLSTYAETSCRCPAGNRCGAGVRAAPRPPAGVGDRDGSMATVQQRDDAGVADDRRDPLCADVREGSSGDGVRRDCVEQAGDERAVFGLRREALGVTNSSIKCGSW